MARYGVSFYGNSFYGEEPEGLYAVGIFDAEAIDYGTVILSWNEPGGIWNQLRLIRNITGYPGDETNGVVLYSVDAAGDARTYTDTGLLQDRWVYYSLFVFSTVDGIWLRAGNTRCYVPRDFQGGKLAYDRIPSYHKTGEYTTALKYGSNGQLASVSPLSAFVGLFGYQLDLLRNTANSALDFYDGETVCYDLIPAALAQLGFTREYDVGPEQMRRMLRNAVLIYQTKGTLAGLHTFIDALTGLDSYTQSGSNLLWDSDHSFFQDGIGFWAAGRVNCNVTWSPGEVQNAVQLQAMADGDISTSFVIGDIADRLGITVIPASTYSACAYIAAGGVGKKLAKLSIDWYDANGNTLSSSVGSAVSTLQGARLPITVTADAPTGTARCGLTVTVLSAEADDFWLVYQVQLNRSSAVEPWQPGHDLQIFLKAQRINQVLNSSFETNLDYWTATDDFTMERDDTYAAGGSLGAPYSLLLTYTGSGVLSPTDIGGTDAFTITDNGFGNYTISSSTGGVVDLGAGTYEISGFGVSDLGGGLDEFGLTTNFPVAYTFIDTSPNTRYVLQLRLSVQGATGRNIIVGVQARSDPLNAGSAPVLGPNSTVLITFPPTAEPEDFVPVALPFVAESTQTAITVYLAGGEEGDQFRVDWVLVEIQPEGTDIQVLELDPTIVRPYFDGGVQTATDDNLWEGVEYGSRSHSYHRRNVIGSRLVSNLPDFMPIGGTYTLLWAQPDPTYYVNNDVILVDNSPQAPTAPVSNEVSLVWGDEMVVSTTTQLLWNDLHT